MNRTTNDIDYREVCEQIQEERAEGFRIESILVNFEQLGYDIQSSVLDRVCDRLKETSCYYLHNDVTIIRDNTINDLWTYRIVHSCGNRPLYDESNNEHYCPACEQQKGILEY